MLCTALTTTEASELEASQLIGALEILLSGENDSRESSDGYTLPKRLAKLAQVVKLDDRAWALLMTFQNSVLPPGTEIYRTFLWRSRAALQKTNRHWQKRSIIDASWNREKHLVNAAWLVRFTSSGTSLPAFAQRIHDTGVMGIRRVTEWAEHLVRLHGSTDESLWCAGVAY